MGPPESEVGVLNIRPRRSVKSTFSLLVTEVSALSRIVCVWHRSVTIYIVLSLSNHSCHSSEQRKSCLSEESHYSRDQT
jgi:hypothetical protein